MCCIWKCFSTLSGRYEMEFGSVLQAYGCRLPNALRNARWVYVSDVEFVYYWDGLFFGCWYTNGMGSFLDVVWVIFFTY